MTADRRRRGHDIERPALDGRSASQANASVIARSGMRRQNLEGSLSNLLDPTTAWYRRWYFMLRLEEELEKARRCEQQLTLLAVKIPMMAGGLVADVSDRLRERLARIASESLRPGDFPGCIGDDQLAVYLPDTDWLAALPIAEQLGSELAPFAPLIGIAAYPDDGRSALELLLVATEEEPRYATVIELDAYRRRGELKYLF